MRFSGVAKESAASGNTSAGASSTAVPRGDINDPITRRTPSTNQLPGRALGAKPGTPSAYREDWNLWIKRPGESDGPCNGGPAAGVYWPSYADGLAARAAW